MKIETVMVVGAGVMGRGIAHSAADSGLKVFLHDAKPGLVQDALDSIAKRLDLRIEKGKIQLKDKQRVLSNICAAGKLDKASAADFIIEAITEDLALKQALYKTLNGLCRPEIVFASNTSVLPINALAAGSGRADRFIGMHFFNPVPVMELVELIRGAATSDPTYETAKSVAVRMGKTTVLAPNYPGFIVSRILGAMLHEACAVAMEGATPQDIDTAMKLGCNFPMGPCELMDLVGLDISLATGENIYKITGNPNDKPSPLLRNMVDAGYLGRKSGQGFHKYEK